MREKLSRKSTDTGNSATRNSSESFLSTNSRCGDSQSPWKSAGPVDWLALASRLANSAAAASVPSDDKTIRASRCRSPCTGESNASTPWANWLAAHPASCGSTSNSSTFEVSFSDAGSWPEATRFT